MTTSRRRRSTPSPTAWLVDGSAYVFRSYYSMRPIEAPDGTPINAVFGLGMTLQRFLHDHSPKHVSVVFDAGRTTFRNELYPDYKANRGEPPEDLVPQFDLCPALTEAMGLHTLLLPGYEADDLLATLCHGLRAEGFDVVVVSGDKDLAQLLEPGVSLYDLAKGRRWEAGEVPEKLGVYAHQVVDLLAIMGDASDNIPGVRGIGQKGALALLEAFDDLDGVYANLEAVESLPVRGAASLRRKLEDGRELAYLSRRLATVRRDVPIDWEPDDLQYDGADAEALDAFARTWGLGRVAARVPRRD